MQKIATRAQSILEYTLLIAMVVIIVVMSSGKFFASFAGENSAFGRHFDGMRARMGVR
jgi:uncharacterized protein (UPF0333 family)